MNCPNCNQIIADNSKFCEFCGAKIEAPQQPNAQTANTQQPNAQQPNVQQPNAQQYTQQPYAQQPYMQQPQQPQQPRKPLNKKLIAGIAAIAAVLVIVIVIAVNHKATIDLADYTEVTFRGYDEYGYAYVSFDTDTFMEDLEKNAKNVKKSSSSNIDTDDYDWSDLMSDLGSVSAYYEMYENLDWDLDKNANLANGDEVTVSFTFDNEVAKKYGIKFVGKDTTFEVSGLEEVREIDPFDYVSVIFSGTAPDVSAYVEIGDTDEPAMYELYFDLDKSYGISKGDTVVVTVEYDEVALLEGYGCRLTATSKEFVCESVDAYITDGNDIGETVLGQMQSQTEDTILAYFAQNADKISVADLTYEGFYFLTAKDSSSYGNQNRIYIVYSGQVSSVDGDFETTQVYFPICYYNMIKYADGTDYVDLNSTTIQGSTSLSFGWWSSVKGYENLTNLKNDLVTSQKADYNDSVFGNLE